MPLLLPLQAATATATATATAATATMLTTHSLLQAATATNNPPIKGSFS